MININVSNMNNLRIKTELYRDKELKCFVMCIEIDTSKSKYTEFDVRNNIHKQLITNQDYEKSKVILSTDTKEKDLVKLLIYNDYEEFININF